MVWLPAGYDGSCSGNSINQSIPLTLVCFLIKYFGGSNDDILKEVYGNQNVNETNYDFIVVGAGAAGCVVASRLSEESNWKVLLLEAGDEEPLVAEVPGLFTYLYNSTIDYAYKITDSLPSIYARGKVMGGSTATNAMVYSRGSRADYDDWTRRGNEGWSWNDVLPYFKKSENARDPEILSNYAEYHGTGGLLTVEHFPTEDNLVPTFMSAYKEAGLNETDYNKGDQIGFGRMQLTNVHGSRLSSNGAFVRPFREKRSNLVVKSNSRVVKIIIDEKTKRSTGVEYVTRGENGEVTKQVFANKEVIVSAGFIESPKLLMLSGIGPKSDLEKMNIPVIANLSVGHNLRDHFAVPLLLTSNYPLFSTSETKIKADLFEWLNTHVGTLSRRLSINLSAFYQTKFENQSGAADIQFGLIGQTQCNDTPGNITINTVLLTPKSSGSIKLNSFDPINSQPDIRLNPFSDPRDVEVLIEGLKFTRKIANSQALKDAGLILSTIPVAGCENIDIDTDEYSRCLIKNTGNGYLHGTGTCKMGIETDREAVVDPTLKVYGISRLRVIDASIMPQVTRSNTMAPTIMIGEKGSDLIKKDHL